MQRSLCATTVLSIASSCLAETWTVDDDGPADFNTIQSAVNAASSGDVIIVFPGTYTGTGENTVEINTSLIELRSAEGAALTIIDGLSQRRGISCRFGYDCVIDGFTIRNGYHGDWEGGGIYNQSSGLTVRNCIIEYCSATRGGGVRNEEATQPLFEDCIFRHNSSNWTGGAINNNYCLATFKRCLIEHNAAGTNGGGVMNWGDWYDSVFEDCVIRNNTANAGGGMYNHEGSPILTGTVVCGNADDQVAGPWSDLGNNTVQNICQNDCDGDVTGNGEVDVDDLLILLGEFGNNCSAGCDSDLDDNGEVDVDDVLMLLSFFGETCP